MNNLTGSVSYFQDDISGGQNVLQGLELYVSKSVIIQGDSSYPALTATGSILVSGSLILNNTDFSVFTGSQFLGTASYALTSSYISNNNLAVLSVYSTSDQTLPGSLQTTMSFNSVWIEDVIGLKRTGSLSNQIYIAESGQYNFQFSAQLLSSSNSGSVWIWFAKNGSNIVDSNRALTIKSNEPIVASWNYIDDFAANDLVELRWASNNSNVILDNNVGPIYGPTIPSVILTVTQIK